MIDMTLSNLIQQLKGSSSSGNYGHQGIPGHVGGSASGGGSGVGSTAISDTGKFNIAKRIRSMADFSQERDVTVLLQESAINDEGRQYVNVIGRFKGSAKDLRNFQPDKLADVTRAPNRNSDAISINWHGKKGSKRNEIGKDDM
jgi:hypothetical protein